MRSKRVKPSTVKLKRQSSDKEQRKQSGPSGNEQTQHKVRFEQLLDDAVLGVKKK
jgi:hypothetical protein